MCEAVGLPKFPGTQVGGKAGPDQGPGDCPLPGDVGGKSGKDIMVNGGGPNDALMGALGDLTSMIDEIRALVDSLGTAPVEGGGEVLGESGGDIAPPYDPGQDPTQGEVKGDSGKGKGDCEDPGQGLPPGGGPPGDDDITPPGDEIPVDDASEVAGESGADAVDQGDVDQANQDLKVEGGGATDALAGVAEIMPELVNVLTKLIEVLKSLIEALTSQVDGGGDIEPPADDITPPGDDDITPPDDSDVPDEDMGDQPVEDDVPDEGADGGGPSGDLEPPTGGTGEELVPPAA